ncbi:MAG: hypothetical protein EBS48_08270 [Actinobacteria bacterium]|nr:hypothetical protein [Actinomycetota bacterium]
MRIPNTVYRESVMYTDVLAQRRDEWKDVDYVGTLSWKALDKIGDVDIQDAVDAACRYGSRAPDVCAFFTAPCQNLLAHAKGCHPRFLEIWVPLLQALGYDDRRIMDPGVPCFYGNYWAATPAWMDKYIEFFVRAKDVLDVGPSWQDALWSDSCYHPGYSTRQVHGLPHLPYHSLVGERLPCFFFWAEGARVMLCHDNADAE